jgi:hypothetical protein
MPNQTDPDWELDLKPVDLKRTARRPSSRRRPPASQAASSESAAAAAGQELADIRDALERIEARLTTIEGALMAPGTAALARLSAGRRLRAEAEQTKRTPRASE